MKTIQQLQSKEIKHSQNIKGGSFDSGDDRHQGPPSSKPPMGLCCLD